MALQNVQLCNPTTAAFSTTTDWNSANKGRWYSIDIGETGSVDTMDVTTLADSVQKKIPGVVKQAQIVTLEGYLAAGLPEDPVLTEQTLTVSFAQSTGFSVGGSRVFTGFAPKGIVRLGLEENGLMKVRLEFHCSTGTTTVTPSAA